MTGKAEDSGGGATTFLPAIEGMRALAVLAVVLAHAHVPGFAGGFVGVDVFFVISGFLICRLLFAEIARDGRIDLIRFWARRVRRLLPNATLTLLATLLVALVVVPDFMRLDLARDVRMAALQLSNFRFASRAVDYFAQDDPQSPVLHFWSLAVEEQFYVVWPLVLALLCLALRGRALKSSHVLLVLVVVASFAGMMKALTLSQPVAFFHSWARGWQLGIGGLLAIAFNAGFQRGSGPPGGRLADAQARRALLHGLGWLGLAAVVGAILLLDEHTLYPGVAALAPTLGAAAMIASVALVPQTAWSISRPLSTAAARWLGARSYSWYLWHWPALIFAELAYPAVPAVRAIGAVLGLGLASLVYAWIEDPIRRGARLALPPARTVLAGLASILVLVVAAMGFANAPPTGGAEMRARTARTAAAASDLGANFADKCHLDVEATLQPECEYGVAGARTQLVLFGDSHAAQWFEAVRDAALRDGWSMRSWTKSSCPSVDVRVWYPPRRAAYDECVAWREAAMARLTGPRRPDVVVLANLQDYTGWIEKPDEPGRLLPADAAERMVRAGAERTVRRLLDAGVVVVIVRDTPRMIGKVKLCYIGGGGEACHLARDRALPRPWIDVEVARATGAHLLDLTDLICTGDTCGYERDGEIIWRDSHHVRASFARRHGEHFRRLLAALRAGLPR